MSSNDFFNELQKFTANAFSTMSGSAKHLEEMFRQNIEAVLRKMDFVKRDELELLREALTKSIEKQMALENEIKELKQKMHDKNPAKGN